MSSSSPPYPYYIGIPFNPSFFTSNTGTASGLTQSQANGLYLQKTTTDTATALETFNAGIKTNAIDGTATTGTQSLFGTKTADTLNIATTQTSGNINVGGSGSITTIGGTINPSVFGNIPAIPCVGITMNRKSGAQAGANPLVNLYNFSGSTDNGGIYCELIICGGGFGTGAFTAKYSFTIVSRTAGLTPTAENGIIVSQFSGTGTFGTLSFNGSANNISIRYTAGGTTNYYYSSTFLTYPTFTSSGNISMSVTAL